MNNIKLFKNISLKYHKSHIPYSICLLIPVILCVMIIYNLINIQTSIKMYDYITELKKSGNYDFLIYDVSQEDTERLYSSDKINKVGILTRITDCYCLEDANIGVTIGCADKNAVEMLPLEITGKYPENDNEILTTREFLMSYGVKAAVGTSVTLCLDENTKYEFIVSGIYEKYNVSNGEKYKRFKYKDFGADNVFSGYPEIYVTKSWVDKFSDTTYQEFKNAVMFDAVITDDYDDSNIYNELLENTGEFSFLNKYSDGMQIKVRSTLINRFVIGFSDDDIESANTNGYNNVTERAEKGESYQDFLTTILMPFIVIILLMISIISVVSMIRIGIFQRKSQFDTLIILGMSKLQLLSCITVEMIIVSVFGTVIGLGFGDVVYRIILKVMGNDYIHFSDADKIVRRVMPSAYPYIALLMIFTVIFGVISAVVVLKKINSDKKKIRTAKKLSKNTFVLMKNLKIRRNRAMRTNQLLELFVMILVSISVTVSYCYFMIEKSTPTSTKSDLSLGDYYAVKDYEQLNVQGYLENCHELGIPIETYEKLAENEAVEKSYSAVINMSSRLCYDDASEFNQNLKSLYTRYTMPSTTERDDDIPDEPGVYISRTRLIAKAGFPPEQYTHSTPMIGITDDYLEELKNYVIQGEINIEKIKSGEEVILLQPKLPQDDPMYEQMKSSGASIPRYYKIQLTDYFKVGETLPLTDILFNDEDETNVKIFFSSIEIKSALKNVRRVDIPVKVGAIVSLKDNSELYDLISLDNISRYPLFNIICSSDTFKSLGLPDRNITKMYLQINDKSDIDAFEDEWETAISKYQYIKSDSSYEMLKLISEERNKNLVRFTILFSVLVLTGAFSLITAIWQQCEFEKKRLNELYTLGAPKWSLFVYNAIGEFIYAVVSIIISIFFVGILQLMYDRLFIDKINALGGSSGGFSVSDIDDKFFIFWLEILPRPANWFKFEILIIPLSLLFAAFALIIFSVVIKYVKKVNRQ